MFNVQVDSLKGIQTRLPELVTQTLSDPELFRDLYRFTFKVKGCRDLKDLNCSLLSCVDMVLLKN
jgi:hypothetical protein